MIRNSGFFARAVSLSALAALAVTAAAATAASQTPAGAVVDPAAPAAPAPTAAAEPAAPADAATTPAPAVPALLPHPVMAWSVADAQSLLQVIASIDEEGLIPADYQGDALREAIALGEGDALNEQASRSFSWLAEDLRDGRTPMAARVQWFAVDPDIEANPTDVLMTKALESHDIAGVLASLAPGYADYRALRDELAATPKAERARRQLIVANMDRWRWYGRDMGRTYLLANVPEFQLRLMVGEKIIRTYRTIVGKPGRSATPQLAETVEAVVFNPTWTVPQSIVQGEGMGPRLLADPASARRQGYAVSRAANGTISVVQQPGPNNSLGVMKIDMPNPHAIYLHDTPNKGLFNAQVRAFSHGCLRTERARELGMTMAILGAGLTPEQGVAHANSGRYTRVVMNRTFPVYIGYFTVGRDIAGNLTTFNDIYGRDAPVLASFRSPRQLKTSQRSSTEEIIKLDNPL